VVSTESNILAITEGKKEDMNGQNASRSVKTTTPAPGQISKQNIISNIDERPGAAVFADLVY
jgi:hypothetical protein